MFSQFVFTAPSNPSQDVYAALSAGCDAVVFLVFNKFDSDCKTQTYGHEFGGVSNGGMCEQNQGKGYTIVVDQVTGDVMYVMHKLRQDNSLFQPEFLNQSSQFIFSQNVFIR